ncbi:MAG TPA: hypothetical protein VFL90_05555 [Methylomirabilota bacterium]|nr:hypothetical protein [Methylomirabilota bacterium]
MLDNVRADLEHARVINGLPPGWFSRWIKAPLHPGVVAVLAFRYAVWARDVRLPIVRQLLRLSAMVIRGSVEVVTGVEISPRAEIGPGLVVHTTHGVFIADTRIGSNCVVQHGVAITHGVRSIGDNVYFGPGAKVIGRAAIGNNVRVVANSVVMTDVADGLTVVGVPARIRWRNQIGRKPETEAASPPRDRDVDSRGDLISMLPLL